MEAIVLSRYCPLCSYEATTWAQIDEHVRRIHNQFACPHCSRTTRQKRDLLHHLFTHGVITTTAFQCASCQKFFPDKTRLNNHVAAKHDSNARRELFTHQCQQCSATFPRPSHLIRHVKEVHEKVPSRHQCPQCSRRFYQACILKRHVAEKHGTERPFHCLSCRRSFKRSGALRSHVAKKHCSVTFF